MLGTFLGPPFGCILEDNACLPAPSVSLYPMEFELATETMVDRQWAMGVNGHGSSCSLPVMSDPTVACCTTVPYDVPHAPPISPMLLECGMMCSHFCGNGSKPALVGDGARPNDWWDPMLQVKSLLQDNSIADSPTQPTFSVAADQDPLKSTASFEIVEG
jgi:hypothetical protein